MTDQLRLLSPRRLEAFSDGTFAIAATLLVLDLSVNGLGSIASNDDLWKALGALSSNLLSFVISFFLLCTLWIVHVRQFEHVRQINSTVLWLNSLRLLGIVLIPFTTSLNSAFNELLIGRIILPLNFLYVIVLGAVLGRYVAKHAHDLLDEKLAHEMPATGLRSFGAVVAGTLVVVLAPFIGSLAFLAFVLSPILDAAPWRKR